VYRMGRGGVRVVLEPWSARHMTETSECEGSPNEGCMAQVPRRRLGPQVVTTAQ
jgi:hypothetical protein